MAATVTRNDTELIDDGDKRSRRRIAQLRRREEIVAGYAGSGRHAEGLCAARRRQLPHPRLLAGPQPSRLRRGRVATFAGRVLRAGPAVRAAKVATGHTSGSLAAPSRAASQYAATIRPRYWSCLTRSRPAARAELPRRLRDLPRAQADQYAQALQRPLNGRATQLREDLAKAPTSSSPTVIATASNCAAGTASACGFWPSGSKRTASAGPTPPEPSLPSPRSNRPCSCRVSTRKDLEKLWRAV